MMSGLPTVVWGEDQVFCDGPAPELDAEFFADIARNLLSKSTQVTVSVNVDDAESQVRLAVAGFVVQPINAEAPEEDEECVTLERRGPLESLLADLRRLPAGAALGMLAMDGARGVDLDCGIGLDIWGEGALAATRTAAIARGISLDEKPPEDDLNDH